ncbi:MAG: 4-hydroxy-3-methylbut-2-enyl diphosphate reductase [Collinsella sp.]|nr:4-hydroxy-3-methylbut-2-enyl diphosphate reductase [Collinsella sp.]
MSHIARLVIEVADHAGVCYGVQRALDMTYEAARSAREPVRTLGPLIHNPRVVSELADAGVGVVGKVDDAGEGTVVIRAHGVVPQAIDDAGARGLQVVDATCPYVKKVHLSAERLSRQGCQVIVVGEEGHPEVEGILGHAGDSARVVSSVEDVEGLKLAPNVGIVVQTTQTALKLSQIVAAIAPRVREMHVVNTICKATQERQESAALLARRADCMLIIGGKNSGNTRRLFEICSSLCADTHHIEDAAEIDDGWIPEAGLIGMTAGASTPASHIMQAVDAIQELRPGAELVWRRGGRDA